MCPASLLLHLNPGLPGMCARTHFRPSGLSLLLPEMPFPPFFTRLTIIQLQYQSHPQPHAGHSFHSQALPPTPRLLGLLHGNVSPTLDRRSLRMELRVGSPGIAESHLTSGRCAGAQSRYVTLPSLQLASSQGSHWADSSQRCHGWEDCHLT